MRALPAVFAVAVLILIPLLAQQNFDDVEITTEAVAGAVHMFQGAGGTLGVSAGQDGVLIIDRTTEEHRKRAMGELRPVPRLHRA